MKKFHSMRSRETVINILKFDKYQYHMAFPQHNLIKKILSGRLVSSLNAPIEEYINSDD